MRNAVSSVAGLQASWMAGKPLVHMRMHMRAAFSQPPARRWSAAAAAAASDRAPSAATQAAGRPAVGDVLELTCSDLAFGGEGVCRLPAAEGSPGFVVFVDRALPGERLRACVVKAKKAWARAAKLETLSPHDHAAEPACQHFGPCGGCALQNLAYDAQLAAKQRQVSDLLQRTAGVPESALAAILRPIVGCPPGQRYGHRNKMEFSFGPAWDGTSGSSSGGGRGGRRASARGRGGGQQRGEAAPESAPPAGGAFALGLHRPGSDTQVLPIESCSLQPDAANVLLQRARELCVAAGLQAYDARSGAGLLQHLVIRRGSSSGSSSGGSGSSVSGRRDEYLVNFVTARDAAAELAPVAAALMRQPLPAPAPAAAAGAPPGAAGAAAAPAPVLVGVVSSVSEAGRPAGERRLAGEHVLAGLGHLTERLCGLDFRLSPNSFFQTHARQAEVLYSLVRDAAELRPSDVLVDLYCGTGSIGLTLAGACASVHGVEVSPAAVADARLNADANGVANAAFVCGDLHTLQLEGQVPAAPDVVIVDPARPGLSPAVVAYLRSCGARRVVYVSCNASTQARDIALLCGGGGGAGSGAVSTDVQQQPYRLASVQAVDLYPQTWHVETVAVLDAV